MKISNSSIKNTAKQIDLSIENINNEINKFNSVLDTVAASWVGDDSKKYVTATKSKLLTEFKTLVEDTKKYSNYLAKVPGAYETLDQNFSKKII